MVLSVVFATTHQALPGDVDGEGQHEGDDRRDDQQQVEHVEHRRVLQGLAEAHLVVDQVAAQRGEQT